MIRVGVLGATGRMGSAVCEAVEADPDLSLVAAFDPTAGSASNPATTASGVGVSTSLDELVDAGPEVVVDFTVAAAALENLPKIADANIHAVVGTTGLGQNDLAILAQRFSGSNLLFAPNFAISAVLMMRFAEMAAPFFDSGEVIELHHENKVDAPSGTAKVTAERMAAASSDWVRDPTEQEVYPGARGGLGPAGIRVHSVRMRGMVAHQEVVLGTTGQTLTIRQDSYDRTSFMPGVVLACKRIGDRPGFTLGLDALLDL